MLSLAMPEGLERLGALLDEVAERQRQDFGQLDSEAKADGSLITACHRWSDATLVLMLDLTLPAVAGTFVGVWGLAQAYSRALGKVMGGGLLDAARWLLPDAPAHAAYGLVLLLEAAIAVLALVLLSRVSLKQFRADTASNLDRVLAAELG